MSDEGPIDFGSRRWDNSVDPSDFTPVEALRRLADDIEGGKIEAEHVIAVYLTGTGLGGSIGWYQGGKAPFITQIGMVSRAAVLFGRNRDIG